MLLIPSIVSEEATCISHQYRGRAGQGGCCDFHCFVVAGPHGSAMLVQEKCGLEVNILHPLKSKENKMKTDPFGNLRDWGPVLELVCKLADEGNLSECQHGLTRILRYRDNWRLREETLKRVGKIENPDDVLIGQVMNIISDENLYYEVRILACQTMEEFLENSNGRFDTALEAELLEMVKTLLSAQHPPIFEPALKKLDSAVRQNSVSLEACIA